MFTSRLLTSLPEALWAEAQRRVRLVPELWALSQEAAVVEVFCALTTETHWQPGPLALAAYAALHPECQGNAENWLLSEGRETLTATYLKLTTRTEPLHPTTEALPATLALRLRLNATHDWAALAREAATHPERWRWPLQMLWGLWPSGGEELFVALVAGGGAGATLAGQCLCVNIDQTAALALMASLNLTVPSSHWLALIQAVAALGQTEYAQALAQQVAPVLPQTQTQTRTHSPLARLVAQIEQAQLLAASNNFVAARPMLAAAADSAQHLQVQLSERLGALALQARESETAETAYRAALRTETHHPDALAGLANALLQQGRANEALSMCADQSGPRFVLLRARAQSALGQTEAACTSLQALEAEALTAPALLAEVAHTWASLGDLSQATIWMTRAAEAHRTDASKYLQAAQWAWEVGDYAQAQTLAQEAVALRPGHAPIRELLGQVLLHQHQPQLALAHFQSAVAFEAGRLTASLGLAQAALATDHPALAGEAAQRVLAASHDPSILGQAHTLLGQALSAQGQAEEAFEAFRRASTLAPAAVEPWRAMAQHHRTRGEVAQAIITLEAGRQALAVAQSPHQVALWMDLAEAYIVQERASEAIPLLRAACALASPPVEAPYRLGCLLREQGQVVEAIQVLKQAVQQQPSAWMARHQLGLALEAQGQLPAAWAAYQQVVLAHPAMPEPYLDLGRLTLTLAERLYPGATAIQAAQALRQVIKRQAENALAHALLGRALHLAHQPEEAFESYQTALRLAPDSADWALGLGEVCLDLDYAEMAIAALEQALRQAPRDLRVYLALARAYTQAKLWPNARQALETALRYEPNNAQVLAALAETYTRLQWRDRAAEAWHAAVQLAPRDAILQLRYARSLLDLGLATEARAGYAQALALGPDMAEVHLAAGRALLDMGEVDQAYHVLRRAVELDAHSVEAQATLAEAASRAQKHEAAHTAWIRAYELKPENSTYLFQAGEALWALGRAAAAVALWQRASLAHPTDQDLRVRLGQAHLHLEQFAEALAVLESALPHPDTEAHPEQAALWRETARAALRCHEAAKAQTYLDRALAVTPADAEARYLLGQALARQGHGTDALAAFQHAARLAPGEGRYHAAWAEQLAHHGSLTEALPLIDQALATSADQPEVQRLAGELYLQAGRANDAIHILAQLTAARPHDPTAHLELIRALVTWADGQWAEAQTGLTATDTAEVGTQMFTVIQKAAALGAEANLVRYWLGRAKAVAGDPAEAVMLLEALPEANSAWSVAEAKRALGLALRRTGQCDKALAVLQASLPVAADPAPMYVEIGLTLQAMNDMQGALAAFKRATSGTSPSALAVRHLAEALWQTGAQAEAVSTLSRAITLRPQAAAWHYRLGQMSQDQGAPDKALAHYQQAAQLAPAHPEYAAALAHALNHNGDHTAALAYFQRALRIRPNDAELWTALGQAYLALDDWRHAAHSFARAILLAPTHVAALLGSARAALALGDLHDAFNKAEAATRLAPNTAEVWVCFAEVWMARGEAAQAEAMYAQAHTVAVAQGHNPAAILMTLGQLYLNTAQYPKAILAAERAIEHQADADRAYGLLGEAYQAVGQWEAALQAFREAQRLAPRVPRYWLHLGQVCRAQGQLDQALTYLTQARDLTPEDEQILAEIGQVFEQRKQLDRALEMYQQATRLAPRSAFHQTRLGVVLKQLKDYPGAVAALEQAVALDPKNLEATKQLAVVSALNLMHGERRDERREKQGAG